MHFTGVRFARFCAVLLAAGVVCAQDGEPVFRTTSELVLVDVQVVNNKTRTAATSLSKEHFQVFDEVAPQTISFFSRDELPLSLVMLFDVTDTVRPVIRRLSTTARTALEHLKPEDEVAVMICSASATLVDGFTTDRERTMEAIGRAAAAKSDEASFFNDDLYRAAEQSAKASNPSSRRVVIWFTDGLPNIPSERMQATFGKSVPKGELHTEAEAFRMLHESGTVVTPMILKSSISLAAYTFGMLLSGPPSKSNPPGDAHKYAELTGGQAFPMRGKNVDERLAVMIDSLRSRYTIGYRPAESKPAGSYCKLRVALAPGVPLRVKEWSVLAREGYYRK